MKGTAPFSYGVLARWCDFENFHFLFMHFRYSFDSDRRRTFVRGVRRRHSRYYNIINFGVVVVGCG